MVEPLTPANEMPEETSAIAIDAGDDEEDEEGHVIADGVIGQGEGDEDESVLNLQ